jgi:hypothetical protein
VDYQWTCNCCGQNFTTLPMDYVFSAPQNWFGLSEAERTTRGKLTTDLCTIDGTEHYIRGCVEIPVSDGAETSSGAFGFQFRRIAFDISSRGGRTRSRTMIRRALVGSIIGSRDTRSRVRSRVTYSYGPITSGPELFCSPPTTRSRLSRLTALRSIG